MSSAEDITVLGAEHNDEVEGHDGDDGVVVAGSGAGAVGPLPDSMNPEKERDLAAKHDEVISQVRKRMSSAQFRPDPADAEEEEEQQQHQQQAGDDDKKGVAAPAEAPKSPSPPAAAAQQQSPSPGTTRQRAASLAAQIPVAPDAPRNAPLVSPSKHQDPAAVVAAASASPVKTTSDAQAQPGGEQQDEDDEEAAAAAAGLPMTQEQQQEQWRLRRKHVFIFTDAGKPVFTRWGDESDFSELFGILQVLMEMSVSNGLGALKHVCLGSHDVHFLSDEHLRFVMVSATGEPPDTCRHQLRLMCHCLLSGFPTVNKILERNSSYDIRTQLLHPSVFRSLIKAMNNEIPLVFQGIDCGFFEPSIRNHLNDVLRRDGFAGYETGDEDGGGHLMSLIVCRGKILAWGQIPNFQLSTDDLLLLIHFSERCCGSASSMENTWAPLCLPDYDKEGSFWVHVMQLVDPGDNNNGHNHSGGGGGGENGGATTAAAASANGSAASTAAASASPLLIQLATHTEAIGSLKQSAQRVKQALSPIVDRLGRASGKVMSLPPEWAQLGVMHVLFNRWGVLAYTAPPLHAQEKKHRKHFLRTLLQLRSEALSLSKTARPFLMRASPFETTCFSRKVVRLKSAQMDKASAELFVTFIPGTAAGEIAAAVNRIWDTLLNKEAWQQFVAARQNFQ